MNPHQILTQNFINQFVENIIEHQGKNKDKTTYGTYDHIFSMLMHLRTPMSCIQSQYLNEYLDYPGTFWPIPTKL
jgi:hypothetical protein